MVYLDVGFGAVEVWVDCDKKRLSEYGLREKDDPKHQECHIASEEDKVSIPRTRPSN